MSESRATRRFVRFGVFEADVQTGELRKEGVKLKFSGQPFQVLAILLERYGEVVTREELQKRLWPDTFVDVERNLNTAVNKIREVLGDSAENPVYVETLPRRGYRFIGEVDSPVQPAVSKVAVETVREPHNRGWLKIGAGVLAISVILLTVLVVYRWQRRQQVQEQSVFTPVPFTALLGMAASPAFSPDGSRIAFEWNGDRKDGAKGFDLYVKALGSETLLRLTQHPSEWISSAWSPDGTQVAFHRLADADTGIYVVPALGGPERKLHSTRMPGGWSPFSIISWSPDGKWIAFADVLPGEDHASIHLLSVETLETRQIPMTPQCVGEGLPAFSRSGEYLAFWCFRSVAETVLYFLPLAGGQTKMVSVFRDFPNGLTWSADDKELIYGIWTDSGGLGEVSVADGSTKQLAFAGKAWQPTLSSRGDKFAYSSSSYIANIWRKDLLHPESAAVELIPSSRTQYNAQYSPDGKRIAFEI